MSTESYQRLEMVIQWAGVTKHAFAMKIGMKRSENLYRIIRKKENMSLRISAQILETYRQINRNWLIYGEGEMLLKEEPYDKQSNIPYYANLPKESTDKKPLLNFNIPIFNEIDLAVNVSDKALEPLLPMGSIILLKQCFSNTIIYGQPYYIETADLSVVRILRKKENSESEILLEATGKQYDTIVLNKSKIKGFYLVCGMLTKFI